MPDIVITQPAQFSEERLKNLAVVGDTQPVKLGSSGLNVVAVEQRLALLGYKVATDGVYDQELSNILKQMGIEMDGILTQAEANRIKAMLDSAVQTSKKDIQLEKGIEVLQLRFKS